MELQGQRSALHTNKCCPLTNRCRRILLANTAASAVRIWLLRGQLLLLLLCSGLQRPTVAVKIDFDLAPNSFDDQYRGCSQQVMEMLLQGDYFMEELESSKHYRKVWHQTHLNWLNQEKTLPRNMTITHVVAVSVYLSDDRVHLDFSRAMASAAGSPQQYKDLFRFKYLHYFLTSAIQLLRKETVSSKDSLCYEVQHELKGVYLQAPVGAIVRFGQFLSTSPATEQAQRFGNQTLFTMLTCLGAPVQDFSLKNEVLVPPYELFKVVNASYHPRGNWLQLLSNGNQSTYNCQLLKGIVIDPNSIHCNQDRDFPSSSVGKETTCNVGDPDWEDPLERGMTTHSRILARKIPMDRGAWQTTIHRVTELNMTEQLTTYVTRISQATNFF